MGARGAEQPLSSWNNHGLVSTTTGARALPGPIPPPATPRTRRTTGTGQPGRPTGATAPSAKTGKRRSERCRLVMPSNRSGSSSYRNNYGWKDSRPRPADQTNYNSGEKSDPGRLANSKPVNGGGALLPLGQSSLPQHKKKQHRTRRSRSNSSSDSQQSGSNSRSSSSSSSRSSSSGSGSSKSPSPSRSRLGKGLGQCLPHTEFDKLCTIYVRNLPDKPTDHALKEELSRDYQKGGCAVRSVRIVEKRGPTGGGRNAIITFRDPADVSKALEDSRNKRIFGSLIDVEKFAAHQDDRYENMVKIW